MSLRGRFKVARRNIGANRANGQERDHQFPGVVVEGAAKLCDQQTAKRFNGHRGERIPGDRPWV